MHELHQRLGRVEQAEDFGADLLDREKDTIARRADRRGLLESKGGVASELPPEVQLEAMQIPPLEKMLTLPAEVHRCRWNPPPPPPLARMRAASPLLAAGSHGRCFDRAAPALLTAGSHGRGPCTRTMAEPLDEHPIDLT